MRWRSESIQEALDLSRIRERRSFRSSGMSARHIVSFDDRDLRREPQFVRQRADRRSTTCGIHAARIAYKLDAAPAYIQQTWPQLLDEIGRVA